MDDPTSPEPGPGAADQSGATRRRRRRRPAAAIDSGQAREPETEAAREAAGSDGGETGAETGPVAGPPPDGPGTDAVTADAVAATAVAADDEAAGVVDHTDEPTTETVAGLDLAFGRSARPDTCPFLRSVGSEGALTFPEEAPADANRCIALGDPVPQSRRQQELVCLRSGHVDCPRYLRGTTAVRPVEVRPRAGISRATLAATLVLIASGLFAFGFVVVNGGLDVTPASPAPSGPGTAAGPTPTTQPSLAPTQAPTPSPTEAPTPTPVPSPTPTPTTVPTLTPAPSIARASATPVASPSASPASTPSAASLALLVPCPDQPDCYVYTVKRGDTFLRIIGRFGVGFQETLELNPGLRNPSLIVVGSKLRIPTPTR